MRNGLFAPWETWRKFLAGIAMAFVVFMVVWFSIPLGVAAIGALFLLAHIWKDPNSAPDFDRMQYTQMTKAYRVASFFMVIKQRTMELLSPVVMIGAGPPREDPDHELQPGFWPPFRLSAWWAGLAALLLAPTEFLINQARMPVWGPKIPWFIVAVLSLVGWYAFGQILSDARRIAPDKDKGALAEAAPATMLNKIDDHIELRPSLIKSAIWASAPAAVVILLWIAIKWPWWVTLIGVFFAFSLTAGALWSKNLMREYRAEWEEREARAEFWQGVWLSLLPSNAGIPMFAGEFELPDREEFAYQLAQWEQENEDLDDLDSEPPQYEVLVKCAAFQYSPGMTYEKVAIAAEGLRGAINAGLVGIVPIGEMDAMGQEINGTVGSAGFRVFYSEQTTQLPNMLDPKANEWATRLNIQAKIIEPLSQVRGIGRVVMSQNYMVTREDSPQQIICVKLRPRNPGVSVEVFLERLSDIQRAANVRWVRVGQGGDEGEIVMYLGDEPVIDVTQFIRPASRENESIDRMNWLYYFYANALRGESGTPRLVRREPTTPVVDKLTFSLPPGLPMKKVRAAEEAIATTSGNEFIEIALKPPEEPKASRFARQVKPQAGTQFYIIASKENPLRRVFAFTDYWDKVMPGREKGVAKINWAAGVLSDDTLAYDDWGNADNPHLLVAGASGSGKEADVETPILTTEGFKRLGDISEGDTVFDANGRPTSVVHAFDERRPDDAYDVVFSDGAVVRTSSTHLWSLSTRKDRLARANARRKNRDSSDSVARAVAEIERIDRVANALLMDDRLDRPDSGHGGAWTWHGAYEDAEQWKIEASAAIASTKVNKDAGGETDWPYLAGLLLGCGTFGSANNVYLATSDAGMADHAASKGVRLSVQRNSGGRTRYNVLGSPRRSPAWNLIERVRDGADVTSEEASGLLSGLAYSSGWRDGSNTVIRVRDSVLDARAARELATAMSAESRVISGKGSVMVMLPVELEVSKTSMERIASQARSEMLFDDQGRRVLSIEDAGKLLGVGTEAIRGVIARTGISPSAAWQPPTVQQYGTGIVLKAARTTSLYPASDLARALLNESKGRLRQDLPEHLAVSEFTTAEVASRFIDESGNREFSVEARPVIFPPQSEPLPVDPYALGAWLGDGIWRSGAICGIDDELFDRISDVYDVAHEKFTEDVGEGRYRVTRWKGLSDGLREMGALWPSPKRIPAQYQHASFDERVALVQGILDTDGHISAQGSIEVALADRGLLDDLTLVLRSLGIVVSEPSRKVAVANGKEFVAWRITFTTDLPVFHLKRKRDRLPETISDRARRRFIVDVRRVPDDEVPMMRCITVDSPTRTYLAGSQLVPTHNSVVMSSMILQIAYNNGPGEVRFWMVEPKNEMQIYRDLDVCERFVDSWSPSKEFMKNAADLLEDAVEEMERRNEAFVNHPKQPKQLKKAREIAIREAEQQGIPLERHPLYMPYVFVIVEECASLLSGVRPDEKQDQDRLKGAATELARKARSAGIHLIMATQYPTKESLPVTIKNQMRSVGMKCQNEVASRVVINDVGLEDINIKGAGKLRVKGELRLFRGFWVQDGDPDYGEPNDIIATLDKLPSNNGQSSAIRKAGETPRITLPSMDDSVFALWDRSSSGGRAQDRMVNEGSGGYSRSELESAPGQDDGGSGQASPARTSRPSAPSGQRPPRRESSDDIARMMREVPGGR